ncbi:S8 family serine peptidase [Rugosimonospora africana]|uniref:Peptidase n=1 Tax=Rugosimonospora africana TaxID=556532 RepID=A0A8J3VVQ3_9ACTN|nr:S8 family serine peptidase [Rugosimonospora africana]GIH20154.1 peptidase [Rugosimonospora africana]
MSRSRRVALTTVSAALLATVATAPAHASPAPADPAPAASATTAVTTAATTAAPPGTHTVTLITGDVVTTRQTGTGGTVEVRAADGTPAAVHVIESGGDLYVYPRSALPYVAGGSLDRDLFDVSLLVSDGYDDAHTGTLPLIVSYRSTGAQSLRATPAAPAGSARVRTLGTVHGAALAEDRHKAGEFWTAVTAASATTSGATASGATSSSATSSSATSSSATSSSATASGATASGAASGNGATAAVAPAANGGPALGAGIAKIWLDGRVRADLADTTAQIGAPRVWAGGDTGQGVTVAVLDTGIDAGHPDLAGQIADESVFVPGSDIVDRAGHGTHVASTIAGTGAASGGTERGVAPGARLDIGKVLGDDGSGQDSWILAGMEWAAVDEHAKIISMSLGSLDPTDGTDPVSEAVDTLSAQTGALFVVAAGNSGAPSTVSAPGAADAALTVGAVDGNDQLAGFSSQGPRLSDQAIKPELTAPGVDVLAARSQYSSEGEGYYTTMSGTSMATPHVAGTAALLLAKHPGWTGQQLKDALVSTSAPTPGYDPYQAGDGRVDAAAAVDASVFGTGTVSFGVPAQKPATGTLTKPVTYTNTGAQPVTLNLAVDPGPAPAGLFTLPASVTVPAGGTATVTLAVDPAKLASGTNATGRIVATGDGGRVLARTAVAVGTVVPYHTLSLVLKDHAGNPMSGTVELLQQGSPDNPQFIYVDETGRTDLFLPQTVYSAMMFADVPGSHGPDSLGLALLGNPDIDLTQDTQVTLDASTVTRVQAVTPRASSDTYTRLEYFRSLPGVSWRSYLEGGVYYDSFWAQPTSTTTRHGDFFFAARWRKEQPVLDVAGGGTDFDDLVRQLGTTQLPQGLWKLPSVYAGNGAASDYAGIDARGKVAVVRHNADVPDATQADAAAAAGVKLLLVVNDQVYRQQRRYTRDPTRPTPIEVALISEDEGAKLISQLQRGPVTLTVSSQPVSDFVYDLMETDHNRIPKNLVQQENSGNLATIRVGFDEPDPAAPGGEFRFDWPSYSDWGIGGLSNRPLAAQRTDWVSVGSGYQWGQEAYNAATVYEIDNRQTYRPGSVTSEQFFTPIERPHLNNNYKAPTRTGDAISVDIPGWGGGDHVGEALDFATQTTAVYQGATLLGQGNGTFTTVSAPGSGRLPYRVDVQTAQDPAAGPLSASTRTEWTFRSQAPAAGTTAVLPLLQLEYGVEVGTDGTAHRNPALTLSAVHLPGATGTGTVGAVGLSVSYDDGAHWQNVSLSGNKNGTWTAHLHVPNGSRFVSIRATAHDSVGNSVDQTVIHAFGVK